MYLLLIMGFPLYLAGKILHFIPKYSAKKIADKKCKEVEFYASVNFVLGALFASFYFLIELIIIWMVFKVWWYLPAYFIIKLVLGYVGKKYSIMKQEFFYTIRFNRLQKINPNLVTELKSIRSEIVSTLTA